MESILELINDPNFIRIALTCLLGASIAIEHRNWYQKFIHEEDLRWAIGWATMGIYTLLVGFLTAPTWLELWGWGGIGLAAAYGTRWVMMTYERWQRRQDAFSQTLEQVFREETSTDH